MKTKKGVDLSVCAYCDTKLDDYSRTVDHLYPKSRGGILSNDNKVPACGLCNKLKADMNIKEFRRALGAMTFKETTRHKEEMSYLRKVKQNTDKIIQKLNDNRKQQRSVRPDNAGSRQATKQEKKRP